MFICSKSIACAPSRTATDRPFNGIFYTTPGTRKSNLALPPSDQQTGPSKSPGKAPSSEALKCWTVKESRRPGLARFGDRRCLGIFYRIKSATPGKSTVKFRFLFFKNNICDAHGCQIFVRLVRCVYGPKCAMASGIGRIVTVGHDVFTEVEYYRTDTSSGYGQWREGGLPHGPYNSICANRNIQFLYK